MKRTIALLLICLMMIPAIACADALDLLKPIWMQLGEDDSDDSRIPADPASVEFVVSGGGFDVESTGLVVNDEYSVEAYAYAVLTSTSENTLKVSEVSMRLLDAKGRELAEEDYVSFEPSVVAPGGMLCISEWLYDPARDISGLATIELTIETHDRSYQRNASVDCVESAQVNGRELEVVLRNDGDEPLREVHTISVVRDKDGQIADIVFTDMHNGAIGANSAYHAYGRVAEHVTDGVVNNGSIEAFAYVIEDVE